MHALVTDHAHTDPEICLLIDLETLHDVIHASRVRTVV